MQEEVSYKLSSSGGDLLTLSLNTRELGFIPESVWNPSLSKRHRTTPYSVPADISMGTQFNADESGTRFSPPPYAVLVSDKNKSVLAAVKADPGWHQWNTCLFKVSEEKLEVELDLEGHTSPQEASEHIKVCLFEKKEGEKDFDCLSRAMKELYPSAFEKRTFQPEWWRKPIFVGGGEQLSLCMKLEGGGTQHRCRAYSIQGLYERWVREFEEADVPIGTITIDVGWSPGGNWKPNIAQWPDMRGFIRQQHRKGRRVLLWIPLWFHQGLPDSWCIFSGNVKVAVDPGNKEYRSFLKEQVYQLISPDGFDADGFKIDMLQYTPCERNAQTSAQWGIERFHLEENHLPLKTCGKKWGCELLYQLQKDIYDTAKSAKEDCLVSSSTVHPYFHDTFDMVRLHDTGYIDRDTDVFEAMDARARIARAVLPNHLIDADDLIHSFYEKWLDYTCRSMEIGVPSLFYTKNCFLSAEKEPFTCDIPKSDLEKIAEIWKDKLR